MKNSKYTHAKREVFCQNLGFSRLFFSKNHNFIIFENFYVNFVVFDVKHPEIDDLVQKSYENSNFQRLN